MFLSDLAEFKRRYEKELLAGRITVPNNTLGTTKDVIDIRDAIAYGRGWESESGSAANRMFRVRKEGLRKLTGGTKQDITYDPLGSYRKERKNAVTRSNRYDIMQGKIEKNKERLSPKTQSVDVNIGKKSTLKTSPKLMNKYTLGAAGILGAGAVGYGGYKLLTRNKNKKDK